MQSGENNALFWPSVGGHLENGAILYIFVHVNCMKWCMCICFHSSLLLFKDGCLVVAFHSQ